MTRAERLAAIEKAHSFFYSHGRGCLLFLRDGMAPDEDRYSSIDEIKEALAEELDATALVTAAIWAVGSYDPIKQAVVVQSIDYVIRVLIVSPDGAEDVGGLESSATPSQQRSRLQLGREWATPIPFQKPSQSKRLSGATGREI